jgi:hypothetical protein
MMSRNTGVSSDIEIARDASRRLTGLAPRGDTEHGGYVRFDGLGGVPERVSAAVDHEEEISFDGDFHTWDGFLDWAMEISQSTATFAVDPQGFILGARGAIPEDGFEGTGAELSYIVGQAQAMGRQPEALRSVALDFDYWHLVGLRVPTADAQDFLLGFVEPRRLTDAVVTGVAGQLNVNLGRLR